MSRRRPLDLELAVQYAAPRRGLPAVRSIQRWAAAAQERSLHATVRFVGVREGRQLNRQYRNKDYATNVLSFSYEAQTDAIHGDLVLCAPVVAREAREQKKLLRAHYAHLIVHGMLHLQGYDHELEAPAQEMEQREIVILRALDFADPYGDQDYSMDHHH